MKITLTLSEITKLVVTMYNLPENTVVEVSDYVGVMASAVTAFFNEMRPYLTANNNIIPQQKIAAIKALRELVRDPITGTYIGLYVAKTTIEDWANFSNKIRTLNRLPRVDKSEFVW